VRIIGTVFRRCQARRNTTTVVARRPWAGAFLLRGGTSARHMLRAVATPSPTSLTRSGDLQAGGRYHDDGQRTKD